MSGAGNLDSMSKKRPRSRRGKDLVQLILFLVLCGEQQQQEQEEVERQSRLEWQRLEEEHEHRVSLMLEYYRRLQEEYAEVDEMERLRFKRARMAVAAAGSAIATQQSVHRRLWVKSRSQAWWERCSDPSFPESEFKRAFRMCKATFNLICDQLELAIAKEDTMLRAAIPVRQRVAVCIWRLATGEPLRLVSKRFGLGISTCHKLVLEVCAAINDVLLNKYVQWPAEERLRAVMEEFEAISGISNLVGAMYTTHIPIIAPKVNVAEYFNKRHTDRNQKTSYSITLQGVVDTRGIFTDLSIGRPGSMSDEKILAKSNLNERALKGSLNGLWICGGPGYPLLDWLLVPYTQQQNLTWAQHAFNEKMYEVQKIAKAAFSRLKGRWRFLQKRTEVKLQELPAVLGACSVLHNVCEHHNEGFEPDLEYEVMDDVMYPENTRWEPAAIQARDAIAHNLLHSGHVGTTFL